MSCRLSHADGQPLKAIVLMLEANMTHPGMRPELATLREQEAGVYQGELSFTMAGDWYFLITGEDADGRRIEETVHVSGVAVGR